MSTQFDYKRGFVVYPGAAEDSIEAKAPHIDYGTDTVKPERYFSKEEADLEWQHLWTKCWSFAGLLHDIPEVGDFLKVELGPESFIIVRTGEGTDDVSGYFNVCPHRGNRIVHEEFGHANNNCFSCDFHGWQFDIDGRNSKIRDGIIFRPEAIKHRPGLKPIKVEIWNSLIFMNMDLDADPLIEHLDVIPEHLAAYPLDKYRVIRDIEVCWDANWKTALDAFVEFYHADDVHPQVLTFSETRACQYDLYDRGVSRMVIPLGYAPVPLEDRESVDPALEGMLQFFGGNPEDYKHLKGYEYQQAFVETKRKWAAVNNYEFFDNLTDGQVADDWNYHFFPNVTLNVFSDSLLIQVFRPHATDPTKSWYNVISLCLPVPGTEFMVMDPGSFGPEAMSEPGWDGSTRPVRETPVKLEDFGSVLMQDAARVPNVQQGMQSRAFDGYVLSESECRIRHYLVEIDRYLGRT